LIAHIVLFRPQAGLTASERDTFVGALEHALTNIPLIKSARVGRRVTLGRFYDQENNQDFPFVAILEFEHEAALKEYLAHPAHKTLGEQFYYAADAALVLDFEMFDGDRAKDLI